MSNGKNAALNDHTQYILGITVDLSYGRGIHGKTNQARLGMVNIVA